MKLYDNTLNKFIFFLIFLFFFKFSNANEDIFLGNYFEINKITNDVSFTKNEEINNIKIKSFLTILNQTLNNENKKKLLKNIDYENDLDKLIKNIIIEDELIRSNNYKAKVKVNIEKKELVQLYRNNKINYTDIPSKPFLIISVYNDKFDSYGLSIKNKFYNYNEIELRKKNNNLLKIILPELNVNDRYILPYFKINNHNFKAFDKILNKYEIQNLFLLNIKKITENKYNLSINVYKINSNQITNISNVSIDNFLETHNKFFFNINEWWKKENLIDNNILNTIDCNIISSDYSDLIDIKNKLTNISQIKSITLKSITYNNNIEQIKYYGDYNIFLKTLFYHKIYLNNDNGCFLKSIKK